MEEFLSIDWNPPLEDMLVKKFVNTDRLQSNSAMYRILRGTFGDPFENMHEDYADLVTSEMADQIRAEINEKKQQTASKKPPVIQPIEDAPKEVQVNEKKKTYVPGMPKSYIRYPRVSSLNHDEQALCLRVMLRFSGSQKPDINAIDQSELQTYMSLMPVISKEQEEYFEFAKQCWDSSELEIREEDYINERWKAKIKLVQSLPRYYTESGSVPFVSPKQIGLNFHSTCLEMGTLPKIILPSMTKRFLLTANTTKINQRFFADNLTGESQKRVIYKTPVSQDPNCDKLAKDHEVDVVISSGGLNCLAVNIDPQNTMSWLLPIVVKRVNEKNVVFVDKPLPPTGRTVMQKNTWFYKYSLKSYTIHPHHINAFKLDEEGTEKVNQRRLYRHWDSSESIDGATAQEEPEEAMEIGGTDVIDSPGDDKGEEQKNEFVRPPADHNLFYRLFSVGSCGEPQNELMKNKVEKVYKLLVRTKGDGVMKLVSGEQQMMMVAPKLEHQLHMGAEAVTAEEAAKQWMSLTFRPDTCLARVRIDATTSEVIQVEKRSPGAINNEINRLYNLKTESALALLYNVAETMTAANPGRYLMRHTIRNGAFATIYKEVDGPGKNIVDLQAIYCEDEFRTLPNPAWPILDKCVVTPAQKLCKRVPALFRPRVEKPQYGGQNKGGKKNKKKKSKANVVRKSARTKGSPAPE